MAEIESGIPAGVPPGRVRIATLSDGVYTEADRLEALSAVLADPDAFCWIDLAAPDIDQVGATTAALHLHPLVAEDIVEGNQRSKIEVTEEHIHIVLFVLSYTDEMDSAEVDVVIGKGFILSVHPASWDPWQTHHLRDGIEPVLRRGADQIGRAHV